MSAFIVYTSCFKTSGAIVKGVPKIVFAQSCSSKTLAKPKSAIFKIPSWIKIFGNLRL